MTVIVSKKVMFVVSSLMGAGHLQRILLIARAVNAAGGRAVVVSGGRPISHLIGAGIEVKNLPPVWSDGVDYSKLYTPDGLASDTYLEQRARQLCNLFDLHKPDVLVTELFPFGRRTLALEYTTLLEHAAGKARIYASIRDVLEPKKKAKRHAETATHLRRWYDGVLVHGDQAVVGLDATWPLAPEFTDRLHYTGYVCQAPVEPIQTDEVLVAVGGGVIGRALLRAAVEAARESDRPWRLRVGGADADLVIAALHQKAQGAPVVIEPAAADYRARLAGCACSVSLFGYNTATDLMLAGCPAVISPMDEGGEREQIIRADAFGMVPRFVRLPKVTPEQLRDAIEQALKAVDQGSFPIALDGASQSAKILMR
ncbi:MAG: glycosyltransferase family protein [Pikeienuella sp.]